MPVDQLVGSEQNEEVLVPLPTDEYTTSRPYPCDFCSRRFRKKTNLMDHMIAHKNVKPNICNLCGARYIRKMELMNHLKVHAQVPDSNIDYINHDKRGAVHDDSLLTIMHTSSSSGSRKKQIQKDPLPRKVSKVTVQNSGRKKSSTNNRKRYNEQIDESNNYYDDCVMPDVNRPFACHVCGVGFAREKALNAHVLLHGVENALECDTCNEVFWTMESLQDHQKLHQDEESSGSEYEPDGDKTASDDEFDPKYGNYYCNICGMAFHRLDLLKRHSRTHKNESSKNDDSSSECHCCNVCGSTFTKALDLLAHAEIHTRAVDQK